MWLEERALRERVVEEGRWVSMGDAAKIIGCHPKTVLGHVKAGDIEQRRAARGSPSLLRTSVVEFAVRWHRQRADEARRRAEQASRSPRPPDDGQDWIGTAAVAEKLGISTNRVGQLARAGRLPWVRHGGRRWFRRDLVEGVAAARAFVRGRVF